ncbi:TVP38/TMEM64 family protein [Pseudoteredinibacter isoporae]|uniref:TVP38/TMEM64 family membrane protein n=1 Tax=Pseudoteredinibacter isoporae TaxID=570281 RepID=A0A7X0JR91_9GAMM|nr:TVP38/TMEM64 family protein [Pseudoteredinibacter isoporae]MBB6519910.1 putative membrane protein YdjX (TVP38/TMEM64 family) [Pseudoteredinibacter isoporae]
MIKKIAILAVLIIAIAAFYLNGGEQYLSLAFFKQLVADQPLKAGLLFFLIYVGVTAASLPGAAIMTLIAGAVFGFSWGLLLVSFASSIGATLAFLISRSLLGDWVQSKFGDHLKTVNDGLEKEGGFYLFTLRLIPVIPFFVINLVFGLSRIKTWTFYWVSQLGMLAGTAVYVNAGAQLATVEELSVSGVLTPQIILAFVLLGVFPWLAKALLKALRKGD